MTTSPIKMSKKLNSHSIKEEKWMTIKHVKMFNIIGLQGNTNSNHEIPLHIHYTNIFLKTENKSFGREVKQLALF